MRWMSVGPRSSWTTSCGSSTTGSSHGEPAPKPRVSTSSEAGGASPVVQPPAYAVWKGVSRPGTGLGHRTARQRRVEVGGDGRAEHVVAVRLVGHPQGHPQVGVGAQVVLDDAGRTLGGEDQVQAERPTPLGDVDHAVDELRDLLDERGELVDDDDQARRRGDLAPALELDEVLGLVLGEDVLAVPQLGRQRRQGPAHQVRGQVGDQADGVRQVDAVAEGRPTLVVDEQEAEPLRRVRHGHAEDPRLQQLGLAGAGGATDQRVRAVGPQVDRERALGRLADDGAQVARLGSRDGPGGIRPGEDRAVLAPALDHRAGGLGELVADEGDERHRSRQVALVLDGHAGVDERGHLARRALDDRGRHEVGVDRHPDDRLADVADDGVPGLRALLDEGAAGGRQGGGRRGHPQHDDAVAPATLGQLHEPAALDGGVVLDDEQHDRAAGGQHRRRELALRRAVGAVLGQGRASDRRGAPRAR